jgi:6-phosphofructokinase 1
MGAKAVDLLEKGASNRVMAHRGGDFVDLDIQEALAMKKDLDEYMYTMAQGLSR